MKTLLVRQQLKTGNARTWKIRPQDRAWTLGTSRLAQLPSLDPQARGLQGAFDYRNGDWYWINLDATGVHQGEAETRLENGSSIPLPGSTLTLQIVEKDKNLYGRLEKNENLNAQDGDQNLELEIVRVGDRVLSTRLVKPGQKSKLAQDIESKSELKASISRRPLKLKKPKDLLSGGTPWWKDKDSRQGAIIMGVSVLLSLTIALVGPKSPTDVAISAPPPTTRVTVVRMPTQVSKGSQVEKKIQDLEKTAGAEQAKAGGKVAGLLKNVNTGRISQLLGKVSAQAARSKEVIINQGVKAGETSGRALAALGKVDRGGADWNAAAGGTGVTVSTGGRAGGGSLAGAAGLTAGRTGQGGVGLIEEESEITGGLDRDVIAQYIKTQLGQILYCYERQLSASPELFGKVAVRFTIGPTGQVESQAIGDTTLRNGNVEGCILNKVAAWKFPAPNGGTKVMVTYPFLFKSTN